jgi:two-component system sensor histidine kinase SenX3
MLAVPAALAGALAGAWLRHWFSRGQPGAPRAGPSGSQEEVARLARRSLDSLRVGVLVLDAEDRPVLFNSASRALGLLRAGTQLGQPVAHPVVRGLAGQVRRTGVRREVELDLSREPAGASTMAVHLRAVGLGGDVVAVEAADVTEAHRVARVRRDFVANVSHELKTPIGALQLLSEALLDATAAADPAGGADQAPDVEAARRFAERIHRESTRLGGLVTELIELSRLQGADPLPAPEPVSLDRVVAEVLDRARTGAAAKGIEIEVTGAHGLVVYGSEAQLVTAVANLVENAVAYSPEGSRVVVRTSRGEDTVDICVIDQGMGIAETDLDRIFERFYRADQARSRATGGTGLGLAIVKHIATNHGGRVEVSSTVGVGSTFTLRLPARPPDAVPASPEPVGLVSSPVAEGTA